VKRVIPSAMNYNHASTDIDAEERPSTEMKETGLAGANGAIPPPPPPGAAKRNDFAASAAMVNDILAAGPSDHTADRDEAPGDPPAGPSKEPEPAVNPSAEGTTSADFFARPRPKKLFWQIKVVPRRSRAGAHSERRRRPLPDP
jgi:hypothetical protein